jgi:hypothetical protein
MGCSPRRFAGWLPPLLPRTPLVAAVAIVLALALSVQGQAAARVGSPDSVHLFARSPVLVRVGERVRIPVDAVCATSKGTVCPTDVVLRYSAGGAWSSAAAEASPGLRFDTSAWSRSVGVVRFRVTASPENGRSVSIPRRGQGGSLAYYVTDDMPSVAVPSVPVGTVTAGKTVLSLPWGTGLARAGFRPGLESSAVGPSSFDVDGAGRVLVSDELHGRVAVFSGSTLVRQTLLELSPRTDVAFGDGGGSFVASDPMASGSQVSVAALDPSGGITAIAPIGAADESTSELRTAGPKPYLHLLPLDGWLQADASESSPLTGMPLAGGGQLLKVVDGNAVRLGTVDDDEVTDAVELTFSTNVGELALAEPDGEGGYIAVVHVWQETPTCADQYQIVHVSADLDVSTFAIANRHYTDTMPLSKFRLGADGNLYVLQSTATGIRIVRYDLGGAR